MKLTRDRILLKKGSHVLIIPQDFENSMPIACAVCDCLMRTADDKSAWEKFKCCEACSNEWAYPNFKKWSQGWRPTREEAILKRDERPRLTLNVNV